MIPLVYNLSRRFICSATLPSANSCIIAGRASSLYRWKTNVLGRAFSARGVLGNLLSGVSMQLSKPFSLGDTIKAGSIQGQVVEMGLTRTVLLNTENSPVLVPNSLFLTQVIVNKSRAESRAEWRPMVTRIPVTLMIWIRYLRYQMALKTC